MIKAILSGILKMLLAILNIVLLPINALIENIFPDMASAIQTFTNFINISFGDLFLWFLYILPPIFRSICAIWFTFVVSYYTIYYGYKGILKIWEIIQKIKFW